VQLSEHVIGFSVELEKSILKWLKIMIMIDGWMMDQAIDRSVVSDNDRVPTHPGKSLKVLEFFSPKFKALKVLENRTGA